MRLVAWLDRHLVHLSVVGLTGFVVFMSLAAAVVIAAR